MSVTVSDIIIGAYRKLGRPSQADMPYADLISLSNEVYQGMLLDMKLSAREHTTDIGSWVTPTARNMATTSFTGGGEIIPTRVEWRIADDTTAIPMKAEIVAYDNINELAMKARTVNETYVSFYDGFANILFSESLEVLETREYRIIYETLAYTAMTSKSDSLTIPALFSTYAIEEVSIRALDEVYNSTPEWAEKRERMRMSIAMSLVENKKRWSKYVTSLYGNKISHKLGFRTRRGITY